MIRCKGGRGRQLTCPCIAGQPLAIIVNKKGMQRDKSNNIVPAEQQELNKRKLVPIVEHSTTSTKDYHIVHQSNLVTAGVGGSSRRVPLLGPGPRGPGAEVITKNEEEIRGGGGRRGIETRRQRSNGYAVKIGYKLDQASSVLPICSPLCIWYSVNLI